VRLAKPSWSTFPGHQAFRVEAFGMVCHLVMKYCYRNEAGKDPFEFAIRK
jgi:hypothetical protein